MNSCRTLNPAASNFHVLVSRSFHRPRFIFRTILARIQNIFNFSNQVRKNYGPKTGNDLYFSFFIYYASKALIDAAELWIHFCEKKCIIKDLSKNKPVRENAGDILPSMGVVRSWLWTPSLRYTDNLWYLFCLELKGPNWASIMKGLNNRAYIKKLPFGTFSLIFDLAIKNISRSLKTESMTDWLIFILKRRTTLILKHVFTVNIQWTSPCRKVRAFGYKSYACTQNLLTFQRYVF